MKRVKKTTSRRPLWHNLKWTTTLLIIPLAGAAFIIWYFATDGYEKFLSSVGVERLVTVGWEKADKAFQQNIPDYERNFAYYKSKEQQTLSSVATYFSISEKKLASLNPGDVIAGTTVKVPPLEHHLKPVSSSRNIQQAVVTEEKGIIHIKNDYKFARINTTLPELATFLAPRGVFKQLGPSEWRLEKPIILEENIRLDIVKPAVTKLQLRSDKNQNITCLCTENASLLINGVTITSYDSVTKQPDKDFTDGRSFIRALKSSRMDILNSNISYLGNELQKTDTPRPEIQKNGGTYGISWRIPDGSLGVEIATGWVEGNHFHHNHFGSYSFGASGMVFRKNIFSKNDVYGLDPHDDSNNALVEDNVFEDNGKHGFIVSKRCNYNVIRNNISRNNKLHGYMLHQDSAYNLIENNVAENNVDNFAIYHSDNNMIRNNKSSNAKNSHLRINEGSLNTYVINNTFLGGKRGVLIYGNSRNSYISNNTIASVDEILRVNASQPILFANNTIDDLRFNIGTTNRIIFGPNTIIQ